MKTAGTNSMFSIPVSRHTRTLYLAVFGVLLALFLFLLMAPAAVAASMYVLQNDAVGGDCSLIGSWNDATDTCTLNTDIVVASAGDTGIEIVDSGITLDGSGYKITGLGPTPPPPFPGVWVPEYAVILNGVVNTEVRNLVVESIDEGIVVDGGSANLIVLNELRDVTRGVPVVLSSANKVSGNSCSGALWTCIDLAASDLNEVEGNILMKSGEWGIRLFEGDDNLVSNNTISNKGTALEGNGIGIWVYYANGNDVKSNTLEGLSYGMLTTAGSNNYFSNNYFLGNTTQAEDNGANFFNRPAPTGGNLWDDYDEPVEGCFDADSDGFCDAPYVFTGNQDDLPLVGWPALKLSYVSVYWDSYAAYLDGILSVDYLMADAGAVAALDVQVLGTVNTGGVTDASALPVSLGDIAAGASAPFTLQYNIPMGIASFRSTVYATAENQAGILYEYPGTFPGP